MAAPAAKEFALAAPPADGVSSLRFSPVDASTLLCASWDGGVRLYDTAANALRATGTASKAPVLDAAFSPDGGGVFAAGLDRVVRMYDAATMSDATVTTVGAHDDAVRVIDVAPQHNLLLTGSWDRSVKAWDVRAPAGKPVASAATPDRVYAMAVVGPSTLVVASAGRAVQLFDLRRGGLELSATRESALKHQTRVLRGFVDGSGFATGSIEGRVAIDFLDASVDAQKARYAFKCHRARSATAAGGSEDRVFPVHAIAFHPVHGTFATGGGDGHVSVWDWLGKKRLHQSSNYGTSVSALAFNKDGSQLAVGVGYMFDQGATDPAAAAAPGGAKPDAIFIRAVADSDVRPKPPAPKPAA